MADEIYRFIYEANTSPARAAIDGLMAQIVKLDARVDQSIAKVKTLGADTPGLKALVTALQALDGHLRQTGSVADQANVKLKDVGKGNGSVGSLAKRVQALTAELAALQAQTATAQATLSSLGTGVSVRMDGASRGVDGFGGSLLALHAGMFVVRKTTEALDAMGESAVKAREHQAEGAEKGLDMRGRAREYANLLHHDGPDDVVMSRAFNLAKAGGYKFDDAIRFGEQFLGSLPAGEQKGNITPEQAAALETEGARFANRIGLDPATGGDIAGVIPQYVDMTKDANGRKLTTDQGVEKAMGQLYALQYGLNEGRGKITSLMRSEIGAAAPALAAGRIADHAEMGAFVGVASTFAKTGASAGTAFKQMDALINVAPDAPLAPNPTRDLRRLIAGKAPLADEPPEGGAFLKSIGVTDAKGDLEKLRALKRHMDEMKAKDPNFDPNAYLVGKGFGNKTEVGSTLGFLANFDVLEKRTIEARRKAGLGREAIDANRRYASSLEGQNQQATALVEAATYEQTQRHQRTSIARKFALGQLRKENKIDTSASNFEDWANDFVSGPTRKWSGELESRATGVDARVRENLVKAARQVGIDLEKAYPGFTRGLGEGTTWTLDQIINDVGPLLERQGVGLNGAPATRRPGGPPPAPGPHASRRPSLPNPGDPSTVVASAGDRPGDTLKGDRDVVDAVKQTKESIERQTATLVAAIRGSRGAESLAWRDSPAGGGFDAGRRGA
jgi:hypothetical protein